MTLITKNAIQSNASFTSWGKNASDALKALLTQTSDSGQINWGTVGNPSAANQSMGYEIYRFSDALQSTMPCYIKFEYGSGQAAASPTIWITVGTGSDGAGNLTGQVGTRFQLYGDNSNGTTYTHVFSGDVNRVCGCFFFGQNGQNMFFAVERTHDGSGGDTSEGIMFFVAQGYQSRAYSQIIKANQVGAWYPHWNATLPPTGNGANSNNSYLYPVRTWGPAETSPSKQLFLFFSSDLANSYTVDSRYMPDATLWDGSTQTILATSLAFAYTYYGGTGNIALRAD